MGETCSTHERKIYECTFLVGKPEGKRPVGKHKRRWKDNTKWIFMGYVGVEWSNLS